MTKQKSVPTGTQHIGQSNQSMPKRIKDHPENGGLLLSYVALASVETIMLDNSLA